MNFKMVHNNINVTDLEKSIAFIKKLLELRKFREKMHLTEALPWSF